MPSVLNKKSAETVYGSVIKRMKTITKCPEDFLNVQLLKADAIRILLKDVYDITVLKDTKNQSNAEILSHLVVEDLDEEQIWQLIELRNNMVWLQFMDTTSKLLSMQESKFKVKFMDEVNCSNNKEVEIAGEIEFSCQDDPEDEDGNVKFDKFLKSKKALKRKGRTSVVDDQFFKLSEMEAFLIAEDEKELIKQSGKQKENGFVINYFNKNLCDEEEENINYKDFFGNDNEIEPKKLKLRKDEESGVVSEQDDGTDNIIYEDKNDVDTNIGLASEESKNNSEEDESFKIKSSFENRQERLYQRIKDHEQEILGEKSWQLKGEIQATNRPQNSLLEEILEFEATTRPAPIITERTTLQLEDIIRQRIKDQAWDDVEHKVKPLNQSKEYRKQLVLDQEKSKESLAKIYEKQYQKELEKIDPNVADLKEEEPQTHKEIKHMIQTLFVKLDALSNFHFTPKPIALEPKIITNAPAINVEEVAPVAISDAKLLAPEEIRKRTKGDVFGSNERNKTDKNRERRYKKQKQRAIHKALEERDIQKQQLGIQLSKKEEQAKLTKSLVRNRNIEKVTVSNDGGSMKSSKAFFSKLQENTSLQKNSKKYKKTDTKSMAAKKLKL